jgi:hypothetical protein
MEVPIGEVLTPVTERQTWSRAPGHVRVEKAGSYEQITARLEQLGGPQAVADALVAIQAGHSPGRLISGPEAQASLAQLTRLAGVEAHRDPGELARYAMRLHAAQQHRLTAEQFAQTVNPIGEIGGTGTARHINRQLGYNAPGGRQPTQAEVEAFIQQELRLAGEFLASTMGVDIRVGGTVEEIDRYIKKHLRDRLMSLMREKYAL